ncbi:MAG: hypothetical protein OXG49_17710 [Chloroflexi bacterium]|nr:hypothetical protein [Chloroflexota bacterium]
MPRVLIVGKTKKKKKQRCVGALSLRDNRSYRLLTSDGCDFPADTAFNLGQVWELDLLADSNAARPHTEDHRISRQRYVRTLSMSELKQYLHDLVSAPTVVPRQLFDGKLSYAQNKRAFIWPGTKGLNYSTGFWRFSKALHLCRAQYGRLRYTYCENDISCDLDDDDLELDVPYVGCEPPIDEIPAGTLLRFSLARWEGKPCYLMLSGWFLDNDANASKSSRKANTKYSSRYNSLLELLRKARDG